MELFRSNFPSHQLLALLHKFSSLLNESRNQKRYLNFYTQLIWEWLFKRDVYNTIPTEPLLSQRHGAAVFTLLFAKPRHASASYSDESLFVIPGDNEFMGRWMRNPCKVFIRHQISDWELWGCVDTKLPMLPNPLRSCSCLPYESIWIPNGFQICSEKH